VRKPCEEWLTILDSAADGELLPEAARRHVESCVACGAYLWHMVAATAKLARLPYDDPGARFTGTVMRKVSPRRARPSWAATVAVLLAGGAGSSAALVGASAAAAWLWFGPERVVSTAGYAVGELANALLSGAQSVVYSGATPIACVACGLAAACFMALVALRTLVGVRRATPV